MYFCYFDESGDPGYQRSPTSAFALAGVLLRDTAWLCTLNSVISFRRYLRDEFGLQMRAELKAGYLIHNTGPFEQLSLGDRTRMKIYSMALRIQPKIGVQTFAVVVNKEEMRRQRRTNENPQRRAWELAIERLERFTSKSRETCLVFCDEGNYDLIRMLLRQKRRHSLVPSHYGRQALDRRGDFILEDPSVRKSEESYFIQLADLNAYAAYRRVFPEPWFGEKYWEQLGEARIAAVVRFSKGPVGIKLWPPE